MIPELPWMQSFAFQVLAEQLRQLPPEGVPSTTVLLWVPRRPEPIGLTLSVPTDLQARLDAIDTLRVTLRELQCVGVVTFWPGWVAGEGEGAPSRSPNRRAIVMMTAESLEDLGGMMMYPLIRLPATSPVLSAGEWLPATTNDQGEVIEGPWLGLLRPITRPLATEITREGLRVAEHLCATLGLPRKRSLH